MNTDPSFIESLRFKYSFLTYNLRSSWGMSICTIDGLLIELLAIVIDSIIQDNVFPLVIRR